jgi:hypothetical protein
MNPNFTRFMTKMNINTAKASQHQPVPLSVMYLRTLQYKELSKCFLEHRIP